MGKRICVVGSLNADLVLVVDRFPRPGETVPGQSLERFAGGKGGNQACAAARLAGPGVAVSLVGRVGADAYGSWLRDSLEVAGVDTRGVIVDATHGSGVAVITVDGAGQNQIVAVPGANGAFDPEALAFHIGALTAADLVLLQLEIPVPTVLAAARAAHEAGATVVLDPAPAHPIPGELLSLCDWLTPNELELAALTGLDRSGEDAPAGPAWVDEAARHMLGAGATRVLVKLGDVGARLVTPAGVEPWPAFPVRAVDTTAAGDTFNAALAVGLAEGLAGPELARFSCAAAALSVTRAGAQASVPSRAEVASFLAMAAGRAS